MPCCRALTLTGQICARSQQSVWHAVLTPSPSALYHLLVTAAFGILGLGLLQASHCDADDEGDKNSQLL